MPTETDQHYARLRGGPKDGEVVPLHGIHYEVPSVEGSEFPIHIYTWERDPDGTIYGRWAEEANV
jgi:hypothetical protein